MLQDSQGIYEKIKDVLLNSRGQAYSAVNFLMVQAYWQIGHIIVEYEQSGVSRAEYGKGVLSDVSQRLQQEFGAGFSVRNLQQMRKFYITFPIANALRSQLSWTHYRVLLGVEDDAARNWYILIQIPL